MRPLHAAVCQFRIQKSAATLHCVHSGCAGPPAPEPLVARAVEQRRDRHEHLERGVELGAEVVQALEDHWMASAGALRSADPLRHVFPRQLLGHPFAASIAALPGWYLDLRRETHLGCERRDQAAFPRRASSGRQHSVSKLSTSSATRRACTMWLQSCTNSACVGLVNQS
jgi:hypothetical protein